MKLNQLHNVSGAKKRAKRVGRGIGSGKGKTCGRGVKGQKSRSGVAVKGFEGGQMPLIKRLPKRGFNSIRKKKYVIVNLTDIRACISNKILEPNGVVNKELLMRAGIIKKDHVVVKLLGKGEIDIPLSFNIDIYSDGARQKILASKGNIK